MASARMTPSEKLLHFFLQEFKAEEKSDFARLRRVPDSRAESKLRYYISLGKADRAGFADYCAHSAHNFFGFVVDAPALNLTQHPSFANVSAWQNIRALATDWSSEKSVPLLRAMVQQYKIDQHRGNPSSVSKKQFDYASSIRSVKAPELRKRVRAALKPLGYYRIDELGWYCCRQGDREFRVYVDYGGRSAQLRYVVALAEFKGVHPLLQFGFERALGMGRGDWNFIVEENVDDVFSLFSEVVKYSSELPDRIRAEVDY
jgi:hypothetical protein